LSRDAAFVDTNVLVYLRDASDPKKQRLAAEWMTALWETRLGRVSVQVLHEYYVTVTRKLKPGMPVEDARDDVAALQSWNPLPLGASLIDEAWRIEDRYQFGFWDSLIAAAAHRSGCVWLLSEDLQDGQDLDGVRVVNPFEHAPDTVL
jgi:predicted nucleic acid-binding protein